MKPAVSSFWLYNGKPFKDEDADGFVGFVYRIKNNLNGKLYIGKKLLTFRRSKKVKNSSRRKHVKFESDWKTYFGSSKTLLEDVELHGEEHFTREILRLCETKAECNYYEAKYILTEDAILKDNYYNQSIMVRAHRKGIKQD